MQIEQALQALFARQRAAFAARGTAVSLEERLDGLRRLEDALLARRMELARALNADFKGRAFEETLVVEIFGCVDDIRHTRRKLKSWMRPRRVASNAGMWPSHSRVVYQPRGVVGVLGAFNYSIYLTLTPLIGALAAGNHVLAKPSELTPRAGAVMAELIGRIFRDDYVALVNGDREFSQAFASLPFDHLVFTGSTGVGKRIMRQAAEHLTPVTLELGGRSPTIVAEDYPVKRAAAMIAHSKFLNAGQTCVAPDHVWVPEGQRDEFLREAEQAIRTMYPKLVANSDYTHIINAREHARLSQWLEDARARGARIQSINPAGEDCTADNGVFPPTLVSDCPADARLLQNEIFGPILPVIGYRDLDEVIAAVNEGPRPLALYIFSDDAGTIDRVLSRTISGGVTINACALHSAQHNLPFGGVGASGIGRYHGFDGFETFSHKRAIFHASRWLPLALMRPPYGRVMQWLIGTMLHQRPMRERLAHKSTRTSHTT
ncbi:MAG: coniferyl aldehyde dehydrogenase [Nevskiales bacterium]